MKLTPASCLLALLMMGCAANQLSGGTCSIASATLAVRYDDTGQTFSVAENATGRTFLSGGKLDGVVVEAKVRNRRILLGQADGSIVTLELHGDSPFLFIRKEFRNPGTSTTDIQRVVPVTFTLDLGKKPAELRTMGTAGLTAPDKHSGSYLFLTLADPETRRGVVAGWLTHDRGDGALFSGIDNELVQFKAQIDYGHLRIPPGNPQRWRRSLSASLMTPGSGRSYSRMRSRSITTSSCAPAQQVFAPGTARSAA